MARSPDRRIGHFEILASLGSGGMGEVYRARDPRLQREVAIKVLPSEVAHDAERLRRFEREAKAAGRLNHPNVLVVHDVGLDEGVPFLVTELVEGRTLRDELARGPVSHERARRWGAEIARGLAAAHAAGIVHRDLKPENVMVTEDGTVKILDFGLAKEVPALGAGAESESETRSMTAREGVVVGTPAYLSPEQAEGAPVDARTDIFSLGITLYEMLSGEHPFRRGTPLRTMGAIVEDEPERLGDDDLARIVHRCLEKRPADRFQSASDLAFALDAPAPAAQRGGRPRRRLGAGSLVVAAMLIAALLGTWLLVERSPSSPVRTLQLLPPDGWTYAWEAYGGQVPVLSPDGGSLAFIAADAEGTIALWVRDLGRADGQRVPDTGSAMHPFWSRDGRAVVYFGARGTLHRRDLVSGETERMGPSSLRAFASNRGGAWGAGDVILMGGAFDGLLRLDPSGLPERSTALDETRADSSHRFPQFLPDGRRFIFFNLTGRSDTRGIYWGQLGSEETRLLVRSDSVGQLVAPDLLLFLRDGALLAQRIDLESVTPAGAPVTVATGLDVTLQRKGTFSATADVLVYASGTQGNELVWVDRAGREQDVVEIPGVRRQLFALSPDDQRLAMTRREPDGSNNVWILDWDRRIPVRFTMSEANDGAPVWSPDGEELVFRSSRAGSFDLYRKPLNASVDAAPVLASVESLRPYDWSYDGAYVAYAMAGDLWAHALNDPSVDEIPIADGPFAENRPRFAPNGRYVAYESDESGDFEVFVTAFPPDGRRWPISSGGGAGVQWSSDGSELFYLDREARLVAVSVEIDRAELGVGESRALFKSPWEGGLGDSHFQVSSDGERFLFGRPSRRNVPLTVVLNWQAALER